MTVKAKAKKKSKPINFAKAAEKQFERDQEVWKSLHKLAERAYDAQDAQTQDALDAMVDRILITSRGAVAYKKGKERIAFQIDDITRKNNALYLATEIMKDLAQLDIRLANYKYVPGVCVECGNEIKKAKKKGKKRA